MEKKPTTTGINKAAAPENNPKRFRVRDGKTLDHDQVQYKGGDVVLLNDDEGEKLGDVVIMCDDAQSVAGAEHGPASMIAGGDEGKEHAQPYTTKKTDR